MSVPRALQAKLAAEAAAATQPAPQPAPAPQFAPEPQFQQAPQFAPSPYFAQHPSSNVVSISPLPPDIDVSKLDEAGLAALLAGDPVETPAPTPAPVQAAPTTAPMPSQPVQQPSAADPELLIRLGRLEAENERLRAPAPNAQHEQAQEPAATPLQLALNAAALTAEERAQYSGSLPIMEKLFAELLPRAMAPVLQELQDTRAQLAAHRRDTDRQISTTASRSFQAAIQTKIPDIKTHFDDPRFRQFQAKPAPLTGGTYGDVLRSAWDSHDVSRVEEIIRTYLRETPVNDKPDPTAFSQPAASPAPVAASTGLVLLASRRKAATLAFTKGKISRADLDKINALYTQADREGRVDHSR